MMRRKLTRLTMQVAAVAWCGRAALAQGVPPDSREQCPIGTRAPDGPAELAQFDFLAGHWDATVVLEQLEGPPRTYRARWYNHWIANGHVMMQEWREPGTTGIELRSFNAVTRKWDGRNLYVPAPGAWYENEAELVGDEMIVTSRTKALDGTTVVSREIYKAVAADRFVIRTEVSSDGGTIWRPGRYHLEATRVRGAPEGQATGSPRFPIAPRC